MNRWFNENMSSLEAKYLFFKLVSEKSGAELTEIKAEYKRVLPIIVESELQENEGTLTSY